MEDSLRYLINKFNARADALGEALLGGSCSDFTAYKVKVAERKEALRSVREVQEFIKRLNTDSN